MAVLCLLTNTPWPWPTPAEAASARGGFPTLGTEWRGRSEAEVCTSEARKIRVPLARARGGASQEGLVSLLGAERMNCTSLLRLQWGRRCGQERDCYGTPGVQVAALAPAFLDSEARRTFILCTLVPSAFLESLREWGGSEYVSHTRSAAA
jgi:hypothetical protein